MTELVNDLTNVQPLLPSPLYCSRHQVPTPKLFGGSTKYHSLALIQVGLTGANYNDKRSSFHPFGNFKRSYKLCVRNQGKDQISISNYLRGNYRLVEHDRYAERLEQKWEKIKKYRQDQRMDWKYL